MANEYRASVTLTFDFDWFEASNAGEAKISMQRRVTALTKFAANAGADNGSGEEWSEFEHRKK